MTLPGSPNRFGLCNCVWLGAARRSGQRHRSIKAPVESGRTGVANIHDGVGGRHGGEILPGEEVGGSLDLIPMIKLAVQGKVEGARGDRGGYRQHCRLRRSKWHKLEA